MTIETKDVRFERIYRVDGDRLWWWQYQIVTARQYRWRGFHFWSRTVAREDRPMYEFIKSRY